MRQIFLIVLTLLVPFTSTRADELGSSRRKPRVGIIAPLSGGVAIWGLSVKSAIELANEESRHPAELFFEDEETCVPAKALTAWQRLQSERKVDILIASCLEGAQAIAPLVRRSKIPFFISGRSSREFQDKNPHALSWLSLLDYEGRAIVQLVKEKGWKRGTAMVWQGYFGAQFAKGIQTALKESQLDFSLDVIEVAQGSTPVGSDVERVTRTKPDVIFLMTSEPAAAFVVKQLRARRYQGAVVLQSSMLQTYDKNAREVFVGALQQKFPANDKEFARVQGRIRQEYGDQVADDFVFSYDGFKALLDEVATCENRGDSSLEMCLTSHMRDERWREGASGRFRFMKDGSTERPMVFRTITVQGFE